MCKESVAGQLRGVLGQVSAGAARRIFDSANPEKIISALDKAVFIAA